MNSKGDMAGIAPERTASLLETELAKWDTDLHFLMSCFQMPSEGSARMTSRDSRTKLFILHNRNRTSAATRCASLISRLSVDEHGGGERRKSNAPSP